MKSTCPYPSKAALPSERYEISSRMEEELHYFVGNLNSWLSFAWRSGSATKTPPATSAGRVFGSWT